MGGTGRVRKDSDHAPSGNAMGEGCVVGKNGANALAGNAVEEVARAAPAVGTPVNAGVAPRAGNEGVVTTAARKRPYCERYGKKRCSPRRRSTQTHDARP
jgi:hypothetical protein